VQEQHGLQERHGLELQQVMLRVPCLMPHLHQQVQQQQQPQQQELLQEGRQQQQQQLLQQQRYRLPRQEVRWRVCLHLGHFQ
jgi:hypothetical protein